MVEIYNYDRTVADRSDEGRKITKDFQDQYSLTPTSPQTALIPAQTRVYDTTPKLTELARLLQTNVRKSFVGFKTPPNFAGQPMIRSFYLAPSLGGVERQDLYALKIETFLKNISPEDSELRQQGLTILSAIQELKEKNQMVDYIVSRLFQYILG